MWYSTTAVVVLQNMFMLWLCSPPGGRTFLTTYHLPLMPTGCKGTVNVPTEQLERLWWPSGPHATAVLQLGKEHLLTGYGRRDSHSEPYQMCQHHEQLHLLRLCSPPKAIGSFHCWQWSDPGCMWAAVTLKWERAPELTLPLGHVGNALGQARPTCGPTQPPPGPCHHGGSSGTDFDYSNMQALVHCW